MNTLEHHKAIIAEGGGSYVGRMEKLVLFNSPQTGSTLALPENELTVALVRSKITESNKAFGIGG